MPETSNTAPFAAGARGQLPAALGLAIALAAGVLMPIQGRINGALGRELGDPVAAALVSFGTGFILLLAGSLGLPAGRAGLAGIRRSIKTRAFPLWYLGAGAVGAFVVYGQALAVPLVGVALFTVAIVTGQTLGSLFVDRIASAPGANGRSPGCAPSVRSSPLPPCSGRSRRGWARRRERGPR